MTAKIRSVRVKNWKREIVDMRTMLEESKPARCWESMFHDNIWGYDKNGNNIIVHIDDRDRLIAILSRIHGIVAPRGKKVTA